MKLESLPFDLCSAVAEANRIYFLDTESTPQLPHGVCRADDPNEEAEGIASSRSQPQAAGADATDPKARGVAPSVSDDRAGTSIAASVDPTDTDIRTLEFAHQIAAKNIRVTRSMEPKEQRNTEQPGSDASGFAPGPWHVGEGGMALTVYASDGWAVASAQTYHKLTRSPASNARLIAAAPELLAACEELVRKCDAGEARSIRSYAQMKSAIAKAKGAA